MMIISNIRFSSIIFFLFIISHSILIGQNQKKLYPVSNGTHYGLVDSKRKLVVDYKYNYVSPFKCGVSVVQRDGHFGILDFQGVEVVVPLYDKIELTERGNSIVTLQDSSTIFDNTGIQLLSNWFYLIEPAGDGYYRIVKKTQRGSNFIKNTIKHFQLEDIIGLARDSVYFSEFLVSYISINNKNLDGIWFSGGELLENGQFKVAISKHTYFLDTLGNVVPRTPDPCDLSLMNIFQPDEAPTYPGGNEALKSFLNNNLKYPEDSEVKYHNATTIVSVIIDQTGNVINPKVIKSISQKFDSAVIEALLKMKQWRPAKYNGTPVCWQVEFPVSFSIIGM